jgi:hypothetical protein
MTDRHDPTDLRTQSEVVSRRRTRRRLRRREQAWLRDLNQEAGTTMGLETIVFVVIIVLIVLFVLGYFGRGRRA